MPQRRHLPKGEIHSNEVLSPTLVAPSQYVEKLLVSKEATETGIAHATSIWEAVKTNNLREVYRLLVTSEVNTINTTYDEVDGVDFYHHVNTPNSGNSGHIDESKHDPATCDGIGDSSKQEKCLQGCSILHLACQGGNTVMVELLLQFGTDINMRDYHGRTPLHHCISKGNNQLAKFLLRRGARPSIRDGGGLSSLERTMEMGAITDDELFILLVGSE